MFRNSRGSTNSNPLMVESCNGVLCFSVNQQFVLYNPATRGCKNIPKIKLNYNCSFYHHLENFSYDGVSDDYKILLITKSDRYLLPMVVRDEIHVYSIRANLWKSVKYPYGDTLGYGVVVNNMLHLIDYGDKVIRSFDLYNERFILGLSLPREVTSSSSLAFLNGHWHLHVGPCDIRIWKNDCWTILFHSDHGLSPYWDRRQFVYRTSMLAYHTKDGNRSLIEWEPYERHFLLYDLKYQQTSTIHVPGLPDTTIHVPGLSPYHVSKQIVAKPWVASLVSLND